MAPNLRPNQLRLFEELPAGQMSINCNKQAEPGFECTNIISRNFMENSKGFRSNIFDSATPCTFNILFGQPVSNLSHIQLQLLQQHSLIQKLSVHFYGSRDAFYRHAVAENLLEEQFVNFTMNNPESIERITIVVEEKKGKVICLGNLRIYYVKPRDPGDKLQVNEYQENFEDISEKNGQNTVFVDQLTYDPLVVPYRLPSGTYLNASTLKLMKEFCRDMKMSDRDPFTGIPYTPTSYPVYDLDYKKRYKKIL
ncbi:MAG: RING finger protein 37 [Marteilia pararefringens]